MKNKKILKENEEKTTVISKAVNFAQKIAQNRFVASIMEGFILVMPVIIASTLFILVQNLPASFGLAPAAGESKAFDIFVEYCGVLYNLSYGLLGLALAIAISSRMAEKISPLLKTTNKINVVFVTISTVIAYMLMSVITYSFALDGKNFDVILFEIFGAKGIFIAMITGLSVPWIFYFCYRFNITIRLPKQVPQNISQTFLNIFPLLFVILIYGSLGFTISKLFGDTILNFIFNSLEPLLTGAKSAWFFILWSFVLSLTWFIGIHTSVWSGITDTLNAIAIQENVELTSQGLQATNLWADPFKMGAYSMGGTGVQIAIPFIILLLCKSKQLKSIGLVAIIPIMFQVNEPILFGLPSILNPLMIIPFLITPVINASLGVIFVELLGMPASSVSMPWSMPTIIALPLSNGLDWRSFILPFIWFGTSFAMWTPFVLIQDNVYYKKEFLQSQEDKEFVDFRSGFKFMSDLIFNKEKHNQIKNELVDLKVKKNLNANLNNITTNSNAVKNDVVKNDVEKIHKVLVICQGAGTSAMVAENINKVFKDVKGIEVIANACSQGNYSEYLPSTNLVVISPQARMIEKDLLAIRKNRNDLVVWQTKGNEFILLLKDKQFTQEKIIEKIGDKHE